MEPQRWLTVQEVAEQLRVHPETVREWLRAGRMRGRKISNRAGYRIEASEVERFMKDPASAGSSRDDEAR